MLTTAAQEHITQLVDAAPHRRKPGVVPALPLSWTRRRRFALLVRHADHYRFLLALQGDFFGAILPALTVLRTFSSFSKAS